MHRINVENEMIKRREREFKHQSRWNGQVQYYKTFEEANNKYENWTSPRYYEENNQKIEKIKKERDKKVSNEERREKLRKLYMEENDSYEIELMVKNRDKFLLPRKKVDDIPGELLKEINQGLKLEEEDRRRHHAELGLYNHWRNNNHSVRNYERILRNKDLKLSWLDQQIQKRMEREKEEEECRRVLIDREKTIAQQKKEEEEFQKEIQLRNLTLQRDLEEQMKELEEKQKRSDVLRLQEEEEQHARLQLAEIEEKQRLESKRREDREFALYNIKQHKMKLKQKAADIEENIKKEKELVEDILKAQLAEQLENETKKHELQETLKEFLKYAREQQELEKQRRKYLDFIFDSESKFMYEKQCEIWHEEQKGRQRLLGDVLATIKNQIKEKSDRLKAQQIQLLDEREEALRALEKYSREMQELQEKEHEKKLAFKEGIDKQIRERNRKRKELETYEQRNVENQLEIARKEEERIRKEIIKLQQKQGPVRHPRSRIF